METTEYLGKIQYNRYSKYYGHFENEFRRFHLLYSSSDNKLYLEYDNYIYIALSKTNLQNDLDYRSVCCIVFYGYVLYFRIILGDIR